MTLVELILLTLAGALAGYYLQRMCTADKPNVAALLLGAVLGTLLFKYVIKPLLP